MEKYVEKKSSILKHKFTAKQDRILLTKALEA